MSMSLMCRNIGTARVGREEPESPVRVVMDNLAALGHNSLTLTASRAPWTPCPRNTCIRNRKLLGQSAMTEHGWSRRLNDPQGQSPGSRAGLTLRRACHRGTCSTTLSRATRSWLRVSRLADGDGLIIEGVEVDGHAERCADLVLAAVTLADAPRRRIRRSSVCAVGGQITALGESFSLRESGRTMALIGARRRSSLSTVRVSVPPLALGTSSTNASHRKAISERVRPPPAR